MGVSGLCVWIKKKYKLFTRSPAQQAGFFIMNKLENYRMNIEDFTRPPKRIRKLMAKEVLKFKCFVCYSIVESIPYCGECEIALPNSTRIYEEKKSIFSGKLRSEVEAEKNKCTSCQCPAYCAYKGYCLTEVVASHKGGDVKFSCIVCNKLCLTPPYCSNYCRSLPKKKTKVNFRGVDADLFDDFENKKAASIIAIIHSGINNKKRKATSDLLKGRRKTVYARDNFRCLKCGSKEELTLDHIIPVSKGGKNRISNLQTLCYDCNQEKKNNTIDYRNMKVVA